MQLFPEMVRTAVHNVFQNTLTMGIAFSRVSLEMIPVMMGLVTELAADLKVIMFIWQNKLFLSTGLSLAYAVHRRVTSSG